jgi:hypothetical protein
LALLHVRSGNELLPIRADISGQDRICHVHEFGVIPVPAARYLSVEDCPDNVGID